MTNVGVGIGALLRCCGLRSRMSTRWRTSNPLPDDSTDMRWQDNTAGPLQLPTLKSSIALLQVLQIQALNVADTVWLEHPLSGQLLCMMSWTKTITAPTDPRRHQHLRHAQVRNRASAFQYWPHSFSATICL